MKKRHGHISAQRRHKVCVNLCRHGLRESLWVGVELTSRGAHQNRQDHGKEEPRHRSQWRHVVLDPSLELLSHRTTPHNGFSIENGVPAVDRLRIFFRLRDRQKSINTSKVVLWEFCKATETVEIFFRLRDGRQTNGIETVGARTNVGYPLSSCEGFSLAASMSHVGSMPLAIGCRKKILFSPFQTPAWPRSKLDGPPNRLRLRVARSCSA